jgi:hypothetical protein
VPGCGKGGGNDGDDGKNYCTIAGVAFMIGALVLLGRVFAGWEIIFAGWSAPLWLSWVGVVIGGALGGIGLCLGARESI